MKQEGITVQALYCSDTNNNTHPIVDGGKQLVSNTDVVGGYHPQRPTVEISSSLSIQADSVEWLDIPLWRGEADADGTVKVVRDTTTRFGYIDRPIIWDEHVEQA